MFANKKYESDGFNLHFNKPDSVKSDKSSGSGSDSALSSQGKFYILKLIYSGLYKKKIKF